MRLRRYLILLAIICWLLASLSLLIVLFYFSTPPAVASTYQSQTRSQDSAKHAPSSHLATSHRNRDVLFALFHHLPLSTSLDPTPYTGKPTPTATATGTPTATAVASATTTTNGGQSSSGNTGNNEWDVWLPPIIAAALGAILGFIGSLFLNRSQDDKVIRVFKAGQDSFSAQLLNLAGDVKSLEIDLQTVKTNQTATNQLQQTIAANQATIDQQQQTLAANQATIEHLQQTLVANQATIEHLQQTLVARAGRVPSAMGASTPSAASQEPSNGNQQSSPLPSPVIVGDGNGRTPGEQEEIVLQRVLKKFAEEQLNSIPMTGFEDVQGHYYVTRIIADKDRSQSAGKDGLKQPPEGNLNPIRDPREIILQRQHEWEMEAHSIEYNRDRLDLSAQLHFAQSGQSGSGSTESIPERCCYAIEGAADSSKNILLHYLGQKVLRGEGVSWNTAEKEVDLDLAIYIDLRQYSKGTSILSILAKALYDKLQRSSDQEEKKLADKSSSTFKKLVETYIEKQAKKVLLLLVDGRGETADGTREETYKAIEELAQNYSSLHILMTVSKNDDTGRPTLASFSSLQVVQLCPHNIRRIIQERFSDDEKASKMNWWLEWHPRIQALAGSPLLLETTIALLQAEFAHDRPVIKLLELYKTYTDRDELKNEQVYRLLRWFAHYLHKKDLQKVSKKGIKQVWTEMEWIHIKTQSEQANANKGQNRRRKMSKEPVIINEDEVKTSIEETFEKSIEILLESGFLDEENGYYRFTCFSFQEFFTAAFLHQDLDDKITFLKDYAEPWWKEVILLYIGLADSEEAVKAFLTQSGYTPGTGSEHNPGGHYGEESEFYTKLLMAAKAVALCSKYPLLDRKKIEADLLNQLARAPYLLIQTQIVAALREITGTKGVEVTEQKLALFITDEDKRTSLIECLARHHILSIPYQFIPLLASSLSQMNNSIRQNIASNILNLRDLIALLAEPTPPGIRVGLVHALSMVDEYDDRENVYAALSAILAQTTDPFLGWHIALLISRLGVPDEQTLNTLRAYLRNDKPLLLKWAIVCTLYEWSSRGHYYVTTLLQELLLEPDIAPLLIRWCILNALKTPLSTVSDTFKSKFGRGLIRLIKSYKANSSSAEETDELNANDALNATEALLYGDQTPSVIDTHIDEVRACIQGTGNEEEKQSCMQNLVWQLCIVGALFAVVVRKRGEGVYIATKMQELEALLAECQKPEQQESKGEISNQLYFTLQKLNRFRQVSGDDVAETSASLSKE